MYNNLAKSFVIPNVYKKQILPGILYKEIVGFIPDWIQGTMHNLHFQSVASP